MAALRARFVRDLIDAIERDGRSALVEATALRLGSRLSTPALLTRIRASGPMDNLDLLDAEELLLGLDAAAGDGSGTVLEAAATDVFARAVVSGGYAVPGDLAASVARLRSSLEHVFVDLPIGFDLNRRRDGFVLFVGVNGKPRTARLLRHMVVGAVRAAQRLAREGMTDEVRLQTENLGDRARIEVRLGVEPDRSAPAATGPRSRIKSGRRNSEPHLPTTKPTLEAVERIIRRVSVLPVADPRLRPEEIVVPSRRGIERPAESTPPISAPPRSDTLRSVSQPGIGPRDDEDEPSSSSG
ncbi:MAG: hypothetical protein U0263_10930 [Polyangiaceae bacterium]